MLGCYACGTVPLDAMRWNDEQAGQPRSRGGRLLLQTLRLEEVRRIHGSEPC